MRRRSILTSLAATAATVAAQLPPHSQQSDPLQDKEPKLPNGKSQKDEILKADRERNIEDARALAKLSETLRDEIEKNDRFVLSIPTLKKLDEAEKLVKRIRGRMKRY
jgi:hypothetical protein